MFENIKIAALNLDMKVYKSKLEKLEKEIKAKNEQLKILDETKTTKSDRLNANFLYEEIGNLESLAQRYKAIIKKRDITIKALKVHKGFKKQTKQKSHNDSLER